MEMDGNDVGVKCGRACARRPVSAAALSFRLLSVSFSATPYVSAVLCFECARVHALCYLYDTLRLVFTYRTKRVGLSDAD